MSSEVAALRTDTSFRGKTNADHHKKAVSPFCGLPINMVKDFPINYMQQQCLGIMQKLMQMWVVGKPRSVQISSHRIGQINKKLLQLWAGIPSCFARKPRLLQTFSTGRQQNYFSSYCTWESCDEKHFVH